MANILLAILGISLLMIVHEGGHYLAARAVGIRVVTFSIGFGPALVKFRPRNSPTTFKLCILPFMAFVQLDGANPFEENDPKDKGLYANKSIGARALTLAGGPFANYLFAAIVIFALALAGWREETPSSPPKIAQVMPGSPAAEAGLRAGELVLAIDGEAVHDVTALGARASARAGKPTPFVVSGSDGATRTLSVTPSVRGTIGIRAHVDVRSRPMSVGDAASLAVTLPWTMSVESTKAIARLVKNRSSEGLTGPVGMTKALASVANEGPFAFFLGLVSISVGLGWFNLLPLPFLDGGKLLFLGLELGAGRRPNRKAEALVHAVGMLLFLGAAIAMTWRDAVG